MQQNINNAVTTDYANVVEDVSVAPMNTDGITNQEETVYMNNNWSKYWGYFNAIPDLKSALLMKAYWNVGKGYTTDEYSQTILDHIRGWGKDSFDDILFNMDVVSRIGGEAYAEIITDETSDGETIIVNLKPLDPGCIRTVVDRNGIVKRYEQVNKLPDKSQNVIKFEPEQLFVLYNHRLADQIHGISDIQALEDTILANNETFKDMKTLMHHQAKPFILWKVKNDDPATLATFKDTVTRLRQTGEDLVVPDDDSTLKWEIVQLNPNAMVLEWRNDLRNQFYRAIGLPQIVPGAGGQSTESESKVIYLAYQQIVEREQRKIEIAVKNQLGIEINLLAPESVAPDLASDANKDGQAMMQQSDTTAGRGR